MLEVYRLLKSKAGKIEIESVGGWHWRKVDLSVPEGVTADSWQAELDHLERTGALLRLPEGGLLRT